jgi:ABC-type nitrate/sulfonate/bicarbonate transport system ATPase subunit
LEDLSKITHDIEGSISLTQRINGPGEDPEEDDNLNTNILKTKEASQKVTELQKQVYEVLNLDS